MTFSSQRFLTNFRMELSILVHSSGKAAAKLKALKVQEENELQMARELMGSGPPGSIDGMVPSSKDDFEKLSKAITEKVQMFNQSKHYNDFVEGLIKDLALDRKCEKCY